MRRKRRKSEFCLFDLPGGRERFPLLHGCLTTVAAGTAGRTVAPAGGSAGLSVVHEAADAEGDDKEDNRYNQNVNHNV